MTIGLKVSPAIRLALINEQNSMIYLGNRRYQVTDRFHVKNCYHCQQIGHTSADCEQAKNNKPPTCLYCMGHHRSANCPNKQNFSLHCCGRCHSSNLSNDVKYYKTHNAGSLECPVMVREVNRLATHTDIVSKNIM